MGMSWAEHTVEIAAPIETSFDAITDYESFPRWQNAVDSVEVLDRTKDGLGQRVRLFVDAKVRKIDYTLRYGYERPTRIDWEFVEGNGMNDVDGVYTLEEAGPGRTRATYKLGADPAIPVPGPVARRVHKQLVKRSVEDLKAEAERRHAAGEGPATKRKRFGSGSAGGGREAERAAEPPPETAAGSEERAAPEAESGLGSLAELPGAVLGRGLAFVRNPAKESRELTGSAVRAGRSVAGLAAELGKDAAARVDEKLSGRRRGDDE